MVTEVYIDTLDSWSLVSAIKYNIKAKKFFYLTKNDSIACSIFTRILSVFGYSTQKLVSCYEMKSHVVIHAAILEFLLSYIQETVESQIGSIKEIPENQKERLIRFLILEARNEIRLPVELIETIKGIGAENNAVVALIKNSRFSEQLISYGKKENIDIINYHALIRFKHQRRIGFISDQFPETSSKRYCFLKGAKILMALAGEIFWGAYYIFRKFISNRLHGSHAPDFDIISLTAQQDPKEGFNDIYWAESFNRKNDIRILSLAIGPLSDGGHKFYSEAANHTLILDGPIKLSVCSTIFDINHLIMYLYGTLKWQIVLIWALINKRLTIYSFLSIAPLMDKVKFFESLFRCVNARLAWSMIEGHDIYSQALTLAVNQVDGNSLGGTWSMAYHPSVMFSYNRNDVLFLWGTRQVDIINRSKPIINRYVLAGYPTTRYYTKTSIASVDPQKRILSFYDNICSNDVIITCSELKRLYYILLDWIDRNPQFQLILKTKRKDYLKLGNKLTKYIDKQIEKGNFTYSASMAILPQV